MNQKEKMLETCMNTIVNTNFIPLLMSEGLLFTRVKYLYIYQVLTISGCFIRGADEAGGLEGNRFDYERRDKDQN